VKVGVWYEAGYKGGNIKITVMRISDEVIKKRYCDKKDVYFICYKVTVHGARKESCDIVEGSWNFRELSPLQQELM
jgi:hypothetical protein